MNTSIRLQLPFIISTVALGVLFMLPTTSQAASCQLTRDLQLGIVGADVKCLQQYLNGNGFKIAETGVGSVGKETGEYKLLTEAAVVKWQKANNLSPASGFFGDKSRAKYAQLVTGEKPVKQVLGASTSTVPGITSNSSTLQAQVDELMARLSGAKPATPAKPVPSQAPAKSVMASLKATLDALDDAQSAIDDNPDADDIDDAKDSMADAQKDLTKGLRAMIAGDNAKAEGLFSDAKDTAEDAIKSADGNSDKKAASKKIKSVNNQIDDLDDQITEADDAGKATRDAEDLRDEAQTKLDEAESSYDDEDYADALDAANDAEDLVNDAADAIGKKGGSGSLTKRLEGIRADVKSAGKKVTKADDAGDDIGDAKAFLKTASKLLDAAETAISDSDTSKAKKNLDKAETATQDALDEL